MPSDNLLNCTVTQFGPSFEDETDSHVLQNLTVQNPPEGADYVGPQHGVYYLVISADPEYRIRASWININNENASIEYLQPVGTAFSEFGSGIYIYDAMLGATLPSEVVRVRIYDSLGANYYSCDNKVIVQVMLSEAFSMPANNVEIKINLNGGANLCPIDGGGTCEDCSWDCESANACGMGWNLWNYLIITNNFYDAQLLSGGNIPHVALYVEDDYNSKTNPYNMHFQGYIDGTTLTSPINANIQAGNMYVSNVFDPDNLSSNSCLGNSKPTCYANSQVSLWDSLGFMEDVGDACCQWFGLSTAVSPFSTIGGRLTVYPAANYGSLGISATSGAGQNLNTPNRFTASESCNSNSGFCPSGYNANFNNINLPILVKGYNATRGQTYVDRYDYLSQYSIKPGDDNKVVPDKECWYVSIGDIIGNTYTQTGFGMFLYADDTFIDVWGAVTIIRKWGDVEYCDDAVDQLDINTGGNLSSLGEPATYEVDTDQYIYYEWTQTDNQCDLDLDNKTIEQIDNGTVKLCVPYRADLVYGRSNSNNSAQNSLTTDIRINKIFVNVWPSSEGGVTDDLDYWTNYFNPSW